MQKFYSWKISQTWQSQIHLGSDEAMSNNLHPLICLLIKNQNGRFKHLRNKGQGMKQLVVISSNYKIIE